MADGGQTGVGDIYSTSRWGIKGSSEVSEGLTAVYRFEHKINTPNATQPAGRLSYVGLSGGFGSLTIGQIWSATYNSVGAITDNSNFIGDSETSGRHGNVVSYAVSVENINIQADVTMNKGWGARSTAATPAVLAHGSVAGHELAAVPARAEDKNVDEFEIGVNMGLGENGKIAFAHKNHDTAEDIQTKSKLDCGSIHHWQHDRVSGFRSKEDRATILPYLQLDLSVLCTNGTIEGTDGFDDICGCSRKCWRYRSVLPVSGQK